MPELAPRRPPDTTGRRYRPRREFRTAVGWAANYLLAEPHDAAHTLPRRLVCRLLKRHNVTCRRPSRPPARKAHAVSPEQAIGLLLAHLAGDYLLQSHWMAQEKTKRWWPALAHATAYTLPFLLVTRSPAALAVILGTHALIDRYRLARHLVWAKNLLAPKQCRHPWRECSATGYHQDQPAWLTVWLLIIADNTVHLAINAAAIIWL